MGSYCEGVDWLSEDLLLLALDAGQGSLGRTYAISYGLMRAELVRLAACGRIDIVNDQVVVRSPAPTGDVEPEHIVVHAPPAGQFHVGQVQPEPRCLDDRFLSQVLPAHAPLLPADPGSGVPAWRIAATMIWWPGAFRWAFGASCGHAAMISWPGRRQNVREKC